MTAAPHFVAVIAFDIDDSRVIASIWAGDDYATIWSSSTLGGFKEYRVHCGAPPRNMGYGAWSMVTTLAGLWDAGFRGPVELCLEGSVDSAAFLLALGFVNQTMPMFEAADLC